MKTPFIVLLAAAAAILVSTEAARASSADWILNGTGNFNTGANWSPAVVPGGTAGDTVGFAVAGAGLAVGTAQDTGATVTLGTINFNGTTNTTWTHTGTGANGSYTMNQDGAGAGSATISNTNANTGASNRLIISNNVVLADNLILSNSGGGTGAVANGAVTIGGIISGNGNITINNTGGSIASTLSSSTGTVRLSGANTFSGSISINSGFVSIGNNAALGSTSNVINLGTTGGNSVALVASVSYTNRFNDVTVASLLGGQTATIGSTTSSPTQFGALTLNGDLIIKANASVNNALTFTGISGVGGITVDNFAANSSTDRIFRIDTSTSYSGDTVVTSGILGLGHSSGLKDTTVNMNVGDLRFGKTGTNGNDIAAATFGGFKGTSNLVLNATTESGSGAIALSVGNNNSSNSYSGVLSGSGSLTKIGNGTQTLTNTNGYTGATTVNAGALKVDGSLAAGSAVGVNNAAILRGNGGTVNGAVTLNNSSSMFSDTTLTLGSTLTATGANSITSGAVSVAGLTTVNNGASLAVNGGATLSGAGGVTSNGAFIVNGMVNKAVSVSGTGSLSGTGTVGGTATISGTLTPGNSVGTINFGSSLTLDSSSVYVFELTGGGTAADLTDVAGNLSLGSGTLDLVQLGTYTLGNKFTLFAYDGTLTGAFASGSTINDAGGLWNINYADTFAGLNGGTGNSYVTITAVPEPSTFAMLLGGLGMLTVLRRRRR